MYIFASIGNVSYISRDPKLINATTSVLDVVKQIRMCVLFAVITLTEGSVWLNAQRIRKYFDIVTNTTPVFYYYTYYFKCIGNLRIRAIMSDKDKRHLHIMVHKRVH